MKNFPRLLIAFLLLGTLAKAQVPKAGHVVMVVESNHSYEKVIGNSSMPYLNSLAQKYALTLNYYSNTHPAIGNYFMLTTGKVVTKNNDYTGKITSNNLARALLTAGVTWKAYFEGLPSTGYLGGSVYPYAKQHNPFAYFSEIQESSTEKNNIVPFKQFASDLGSGALPQFSFVVPGMRNNMHDCPATAPCSESDKAQAADNWLKTNIAPLLANPEFQKDGLLIITWDEGNTNDAAHGGGHVATVVIGPSVKRNYKSQSFYQGQSLLRTSLAALGITDNVPGAAATAPLMDDLFIAPTTEKAATEQTAMAMAATTATATSSCTAGATVPSITICSPTSTSGSPIHVSAAARASTAVNYMAVWVDGVKKYQAYASSLDTSIATGAGSHRVTVQAKDSKGVLFSKTIYTTVSGTSGHSVALSWTASSSSSIKGYRIYRSSTSGGPYTLLNGTVVTSTKYTDTTVKAGAKYYYCVTTVNTKGAESGYSKQVSATIPTP